jgi:hypothetical protein
MYEEFEFLSIVGVVTRVLPVDCGVQALKILDGFVCGRGKFTSGKLAGWDTVGKFGLWPVHSVLGRLEKEGVINGYWYHLIGEHTLRVRSGLG